jgi:predicted DNA-binding protein (MmcQ/YjbR family)
VNADDLKSICEKLPGVTSDIKWGYDLCFSVGGKMFLVTGIHDPPIGASFKTDAESFEQMSTRKGFKPAAYLARHHWVQVENINTVSLKEWQQFISNSYELVKAKLPKKLRESLG